MYSEKVMDHFSNPRNVGQIDNANAVGEVGNAKCGDIMKIYMDIQDDVIKDVKFKTFGCGAAIATSSMATEMVMEALDGLPKEKIHCSVLAEEAIQSAINDYRSKKGEAPLENNCDFCYKKCDNSDK